MDGWMDVRTHANRCMHPCLQMPFPYTRTIACMDSCILATYIHHLHMYIHAYINKYIYIYFFMYTHTL